MVGNYLTPRLVRTSLLSQKSPTCEASLPWSIQGVFKHGKLPSAFFSSMAGKSPRKSAMIFPAKNTFFLMVFPCLSHILWLSFPSRVGTSHRCLSWIPHRRRARQRSTSLSSAASWRSTTRKWRLVAAGGPLPQWFNVRCWSGHRVWTFFGGQFWGTKTSAQSYHSYFYPSSSKRYLPNKIELL